MQRQLPIGFIDSLRGLTGFKEEAFVSAQVSGIPPVSIRLNPFKEWEGKTLLLNEEQVLWCQNGFYLSKRPSFTSDPLFHAGAYYVQEASSMFLQHVLKQLGGSEPEKIAIDLCAAPGGKSTLIQSVLHPTSLLVSNEVIKSRVNVLQENLQKWGAGNSVITQNDPSQFGNSGPFCHFLIVDAPCSGSGLFRKDEGAIAHWSQSQVSHCSLRQKRILEQSIPALKEGGFLIYSTCSFSKNENEDIGEWLNLQHGLEPVQIETDPAWNIVESCVEGCFGYRFYPHILKGEGFFISAFKKPGQSESTPFKGKRKLEFTPPKTISRLKNFITNVDDYTIFNHQGRQVAFWERHIPFLEWALGTFFIKQAGTCIGEMVKNELLPHHALAMSQHIRPLAEKVNIDLDVALNYLRRASISIEGAPGWKLLSYNNLPLGWVKILPNRVNNYYPKEWRILNR